MSARILGFVVIGLMFTVSNLASGRDKLTKFHFVQFSHNKVIEKLLGLRLSDFGIIAGGEFAER